MNYSIVIPAHNEEAFIGITLESISKQSVLPSEVIVVDDNSTDRTYTIAVDYTKNYSFIKVIKQVSDSSHQPGSKVVHAFLKGFSKLSSKTDIIVKLDADLVLPTNYFETIIKHFQSDEKIGMVGGFAYIEKDGNWVLENLTSKDHIRGAFKAYRKECYSQIGGLQPAMGWDTADEFIARFYGWKIITDESLHIQHLKPTGSNYKAKSAQKQGQAFYALGYGFWLTLIASIKLALLKNKPGLTIAYISGFVKASLQKAPKLVTKEQAQFVRKYRWKGIKKKFRF
ncbi:MAG: glycosyltransferase family 2 protein [Flavobacteriales bacterium]|nr:glycosyltransferase family 2 protein [Flavobacteriales bacterium]